MLYHKKLGQPSLAPGICFRVMLIVCEEALALIKNDQHHTEKDPWRQRWRSIRKVRLLTYGNALASRHATAALLQSPP